MVETLATSEGYCKVNGHDLYFKWIGEVEKGVILTVHGGPGMTHHYMLSLADLAKFGYRVIFYDQLGCGKSEVPKDESVYNIQREVEDLEGLRVEMNLGKMHLIGSSFGGMVAIAYALKYQKNLESLILASAVGDNILLGKEVDRLWRELSPDVLRL